MSSYSFLPARRYITDHEDGSCTVHAEDGSVLGNHKTHAECVAQLGAIEASKAKKSLPLPGLEVRSLPLAHAQLRVKRDDKAPPKIVGYSAVFNSLSENLGGFREKILPGAFSIALEKSDCRALINHDANLLIGRQSSGTLKLAEDETGLRMEITPPDSEIARHFLAAIDRGDLTGASFSFTIDDGNDDWDEDDDGRIVRTIRSVRDIFDVGPVTFPAYLDTTVASRSLQSRPRLAERRCLQRLRLFRLLHPSLFGGNSDGRR